MAHHREALSQSKIWKGSYTDVKTPNLKLIDQTENTNINETYDHIFVNDQESNTVLYSNMLYTALIINNKLVLTVMVAAGLTNEYSLYQWLEDHLLQWGEAGQSRPLFWRLGQWMAALSVGEQLCMLRVFTEAKYTLSQCAPVPSTPLCILSQWKTGDHKKASNSAGIAFAKALLIWIHIHHSKQNQSTYSAHIHPLKFNH